MPSGKYSYAKTTQVQPSTNLDKIWALLKRAGASEYEYHQYEHLAEMRFTYGGWRMVIRMPLHGTAQQVRTRWSTLLLGIKAKIALIDCEASTIEEEFWGSVLLPNDQTVMEATRDYVREAQKTGLYGTMLAKMIPPTPAEVIELGEAEFRQLGPSS